jgi:hypothetical protein
MNEPNTLLLRFDNILESDVVDRSLTALDDSDDQWQPVFIRNE